MKKKYLGVVVILLIAIVLTMAVGCGGGKKSSGGGKAGSTEGLRVGFTISTLGEAFWEANLVGVQRATDELGWTLSVQSSQNDPTEQVKHFENFISQKMDAIIFAPVDAAAILESVKKCNDAGIPVFSNYRVPDKSDDAVVDYGVCNDIQEIGRITGEWLANKAKAEGKKYTVIEVMGALNDNHSVGCRDGFKEAVDANPDQLEIIVQVPGDWLVDKATAGTLAALQANPDVDAIYYHSDYYYPGIESALKQVDRFKKIGEEGHVILAPIGGTKESLDGIRDSYIDCLGVCVPVECGYRVVYTIKELLEGKLERGGLETYPSYVLDITNYEEKSDNVFGYVYTG